MNIKLKSKLAAVSLSLLLAVSMTGCTFINARENAAAVDRCIAWEKSPAHGNLPAKAAASMCYAGQQLNQIAFYDRWAK